jgi:protein TilB
MTERLIARQEAKAVKRDILFAEAEYKAGREVQKQSYVEDLGSSDEENFDNDEYWNKVTPNTPEVRKEMALRAMKLEEKSKEAKGSTKAGKKERKELSLFYTDGRPKNINQPKMTFSLQDNEEQNALTLNINLPKYMDSSLIDADVQPTYARVVVKGKIFQIVLPEEIKPDSSTAQRSKTTGHLLITMPKLQQSSENKRGFSVDRTGGTINNAVDVSVNKSRTMKGAETGGAASTTSRNPDWRNIVPKDKGESPGKGDEGQGIRDSSKEKKEEVFIDDANVPPLI